MKKYEAKCLHSSTMEGLATSAERDSIKYMQVKYMQDHKDQEFFGVISVLLNGNFVEISKINVKVCVESEI
jgi:ribonuclease R